MLGFANPWGLLGLLSLPTIIVIHMFHRRFPPLIIAGSHLWGLESETRAPGRRRERLPITKTLLLELLAALILTLILSRPEIGNLNSVPHLIVVLDNSASMSASLPDQASFRDLALETLRERVDAMGSKTVVTLIQTGPRPESLSGTPVRWIDAESLLERWRPHKPEHDFQASWDIASQLAENGGQLLFLTNRLPDENMPIPQDMEIVSVGRPLTNVALTMARWKSEPAAGKQSINLRIHNFSPRQTSVSLVARAGDVTVFDEQIRIESNATRPVSFQVDPGLQQLQLTLDSRNDCLALDNSAVLIEPRSRPVNLSIDLPKEHAAYPAVRRAFDAIPQTFDTSAETASLVIAAADTAPTSRQGLWWLSIGPLDSSEEARKDSVNLLSPFLLEKRAPILEGVVMGGILWGGAQRTDEALSPLVSADEIPLFAARRAQETRAYLLNMDFEYSNLADSPDWPILINNLATLCRDDQPGLRRWNYRLNEIFRFRAPTLEDTAQIELEGPRATRRLARDRHDTVEVTELSEPGVYQIAINEELWDRFAVNFHDLKQSNLLRLEAGTREIEADDSWSLQIDSYYTWLMLLGILITMAAVVMNWIVLRQPQ